MSTVVSYLLLAVLMFGINTVLWSCVGTVRWLRHVVWPTGVHQYTSVTRRVPMPRLDQVAVLMAAHNEEGVIAAALTSLKLEAEGAIRRTRDEVVADLARYEVSESAA